MQSAQALKRAIGRLFPQYEALKRKYRRPGELPRKFAELAPHLADYEVLRERVWLPYVMSSVYPRIQTPSVNTDGYGFRYVIDRDGQRLSPESGSDAPVSILVGGSTSFGVGATSDATTIASILAVRRGEPWFNLSVRGFTLAQNLVQTLFLLPKIGEIREVVLFAGLNDLQLYFKTAVFPRLYGGFYDWMEYFSALNPQFFRASARRISFPESFRLMFETIESHSHHRHVLEESLFNTLTNWKFIAEAKGARICFALQPVLSWMDRDLSPEEERFARKKMTMKKKMEAADAAGDWYRAFLRRSCEELEISFTDFNECFGKAAGSPRWLFYDNCHFTDDGSREAARIIGRMLGPDLISMPSARNDGRPFIR